MRAVGILRRGRALLERGRAGLPPADLLLLVPRLPRTLAVLGGRTPWETALDHWGLTAAPPATADLLVSARSGGDVRRLRAPLVLLTGRVPRRRWEAAGYSLVRYRLRRLPRGVVLAAPGRADLALGRRTWQGRDARGGPARVVGALVRPSAVTVAALGDTAPAAVRRSGLVPDGSDPSALCLAVDPRDDRRRAVFLAVAPGREAAVVKVDRTASAEDRASHEQAVLELLPRGSPVPRPLGGGSDGRLRWSCESLLTGVPLAEAPRRLVLPAIEQVSRFLGELAVATAHPVDWAAGGPDDVVTLRGPAQALRGRLELLSAVPAVVTHGDLESGHNIVLDAAGRAAVLDWETGRRTGLPLLDLLPLLCTWSPAASRSRDPSRRAEQVCALAAGRAPGSAWLLDHVAGYARRLQLPPDALGPLAELAWGAQASMRLARDELLVRAGLPVHPWTSTAELVLGRWQSEVGPDWPALRERLER